MRVVLQYSALAGLLSLVGCANHSAPDQCSARMSEFQAIGSHNSYKLAIPPAELALIEAQEPEWAVALDYAHAPLTEQLDLGMRQLELDVFYDPEGGRYADPLVPRLVGATIDRVSLKEPGFKVLHVHDVDGRSNCYRFTQCLSEIRDWSSANPDHLPMLILINAKQAPIELPESVRPLAFDAAAFEALDAEIRSIFGVDHLLTPDDVRGDAATLREAIAADGWPMSERTRGQVFFALDEAPTVVEVYRRGEPSLNGHAMFVNSSDPNAPDAAYFTLNDPIADGAVITERVRQGFIVRTRADANTMEARTGDTARLNAALASGAQYVSTDYYQARTEWSDYVAQLPNGAVSRINPVSNCAFR